ncbi:11589_t:CDS:2, partial [Gigaspora margarita]
MSSAQEENQEEDRITSQTSQELGLIATNDETAENAEPVLSDELKKAFNSMNSDSSDFYHNLRDKNAKISFLKAIISIRKDERKRGESAINLLVNLAAFVIVVSFIVENASSKNEVYEIISYAMAYCIQYFAIILVLGREKGFTRKSFLNALYSSVPFILSCLITSLIVIYLKIEPTSAIALIGVGVLFSDW